MGRVGDEERAHALLAELLQRTERVHELQNALSARVGVGRPPRNARQDVDLLLGTRSDLNDPSSAGSIKRSSSARTFDTADADSDLSSEPGTPGSSRVHSPSRRSPSSLVAVRQAELTAAAKPQVQGHQARPRGITTIRLAFPPAAAPAAEGVLTV